MKRADFLQHLEDRSRQWDVLVIGGGATGLGCAVEAASRGYRTVLVEQADFAQSTSSRSTKLIHGGFRYLKHGNLSLVRHSLRERGLVLRNAPHLACPLHFVVPCYAWWERSYYGLGLKLYDALAGSKKLERCRILSRGETCNHLPTLETEKLRGGVRYVDGQFDDARLAICLAQTLAELGGIPLNYMAAVSLRKDQGRMAGVQVCDQETGREFALRARVTINAAGIFTDHIRRLDQPDAPRMVTVSQGSHLVLPRKFLPGPNALMVPKTDDNRILFVIPWQNRLLVGTTDLPRPAPEMEPASTAEEIAFLLEHTARYLTQDPTPQDILSVFSGLRPLVSANPNSNTSRIARDHVILVSSSGLVTVTGGKWTTYRQMGEETVDRAAAVGGLEARPSQTKSLRLHGWREPEEGAVDSMGSQYGADRDALDALVRTERAWGKPLHARLPYCQGEVVWAARHELARTVEDVLARRTRALLLDAQAALEAAPRAAALLRSELGRNTQWESDQLTRFQELARRYMPH